VSTGVATDGSWVRKSILVVVVAALVLVSCGGAAAGKSSAPTRKPLTNVMLSLTASITYSIDGNATTVALANEVQLSAGGGPLSRFTDVGGFGLFGCVHSNGANSPCADQATMLQITGTPDPIVGTVHTRPGTCTPSGVCTSLQVFWAAGHTPTVEGVAHFLSMNGECDLTFTKVDRSTGISGSFDCENPVATNANGAVAVTAKGTFDATVK
jgi:hypothetical protein